MAAHMLSFHRPLPCQGRTSWFPPSVARNCSKPTNCFRSRWTRCSAASTSLSTVSSAQDIILHCFVPFLLPATAAVATGTYAGVLPLSPDAAPWLRPLLVGAGPLVLHGLVPLLDRCLGQLRREPLLASAKPPAADDMSARLVPVLAIGVHLAVAAAALAAVAAAAPAQPPPPLLTALLAVTLGVSAGTAMAASHELVHSRNPVHLAAAVTFLTMYWWYPYYRAHHQHHLHVCTPQDYTCAPTGQDIYSYIVQYYTASYAEAWQLSAQECDRAGRPHWSRHNSTLVALGAQVLLTAGIFTAFGPVATAVHLGSVAVLATYMAILDYILHYGLERPPLKDNPRRHTPITPYTSWNSLYPLENAVLFNVLLHSDHHLYGYKSYGWLRPTPAAPPVYPAPVLHLALAVFIPPLWRRLMDDRAVEANAQHLEYLGLGHELSPAEQQSSL